MTHPFVLIVGPTASGKSALALALAAEAGAGILCCDSLQTYRRLDIGTAKPTPTERARVPHYLFDAIEPGEVLTAGDFRRGALEVLARELPRRPVFGVGGSGFYIQALEKGMFDLAKPAPAVEAAVRAELEARGLKALHAELARLDPEYAEELNPNDAYRIVRALVIIRDAGETVTSLKRRFRPQPFPYPLLKLGLAPTREWLLPRVRERARAMLAQGLLAEARGLVAEGWGDWPPLQSVGYRECLQVLRGELPEAALENLIAEKTIQLAKKQRTWFKRDAGIRWLDVTDPLPPARAALAEFRARLA